MQINWSKYSYIIGGAFLSICLTYFFFCNLEKNETNSISESLVQGCYVWQKNWTPPVIAAIKSKEPFFNTYNFLGAEISFVDQKPNQAVYAAMNYDVLKTLTIPIGISLRIGRYNGPFKTDGNAYKLIKRTLDTILNELSAEGIQIQEIQIDFDCPTAKLKDYLIWLKEIKKGYPNLNIAFTSLPTWLQSNDFKQLADATDYYILQLHSLDKKAPHKFSKIFKPDLAKRALQNAISLKQPFWVALPTYGYQLIYHENGALIKIVAEQGVDGLPYSFKTDYIITDPHDLSIFVKDLHQNRRRYMKGVIWYRLPVESDQMNWKWQTLQLVMDGKTPKANLTVSAVHQRNGLYDLFLINTGERSCSLNKDILFKWHNDTQITAYDPLNQFDCKLNHPNAICFFPKSKTHAIVLPVNKKLSIGWLKLNKETKVTYELKNHY